MAQREDALHGAQSREAGCLAFVPAAACRPRDALTFGLRAVTICSQGYREPEMVSSPPTGQRRLLGSFSSGVERSNAEHEAVTQTGIPNLSAIQGDGVPDGGALLPLSIPGSGKTDLDLTMIRPHPAPTGQSISPPPPPSLPPTAGAFPAFLLPRREPHRQASASADEPGHRQDGLVGRA